MIQPGNKHHNFQAFIDKMDSKNENQTWFQLHGWLCCIFFNGLTPPFTGNNLSKIDHVIALAPGSGDNYDTLEDW